METPAETVARLDAERAARLERLRAALARERANLHGTMKALQGSGRPVTPLYAEFIRQKTAEVSRLTAELEREGG